VNHDEDFIYAHRDRRRKKKRVDREIVLAIFLKNLQTQQVENSRCARLERRSA